MASARRSAPVCLPSARYNRGWGSASASTLRRTGSVSSAERWKDGAHRGYESPPDHRRPRVPSECASRVKHPLDSGVHLFLFDEFPPRNLVNPDLHLFLEPLAVRKQAGDGLLDQVIRSPPRSEGKIVQLGLLISGKSTSIAFRVLVKHARVKRLKRLA